MHAIDQSQLFNRIVEKIIVDFPQIHTLIFVGSRAYGNFDAESDYDFLAITSKGEKERLANYVKDVFIDILMYPEKLITTKEEIFHSMCNGKIIFQHKSYGNKFLKIAEKVNSIGPVHITDQKIAFKKYYLIKNLKRIRDNSLRSNYYRAQLLEMALRDYFFIRKLWFQSIRKSINWLKENDTITYTLYSRALDTATADIKVLTKLVDRIVSC